jgi:hypothetical protein
MYIYYYIISIVITIIVIIIITINNTSYDTNVEHYDNRIIDYDLNQCVNWCKTTENCYGIGYDKEKKICYPAQFMIDKPPPENVLFRSEYRAENAACNKLQPIITENNKIGFEERRKNSVFVCKEDETKQPQWFVHNNNKFENIGEGNNIDNIFDIDDYKVGHFEWPINKYDNNQIDLLLSDHNKQTYNDNNITSIDRIENPVIKPTIIKLPIYNPDKIQLDFGLDNIYSYMNTNYGNTSNIRTNNIHTNNIHTGGNHPSKYHLDIINRLKNGLQNSFNLLNMRGKMNVDNKYQYIQHNDYNTGDYLMPHKCLSNISELSCLKLCSDNPNCVGCEWNPVASNLNNICCLKSNIKKFVPRNEMIKNGKFYEKI